MLTNLKSWWNTEVRRLKVPQYTPKLRGSYHYKVTIWTNPVLARGRVLIHSDTFALRKEAEAFKRAAKNALSQPVVELTPIAKPDKDGWIPS